MSNTDHRAIAFFLEHAGYSYDPKTETPEQGRARCAEELAEAEAEASALGYYFEWEVDTETTSAEWSDDPDPYAVWNCVAYDVGGTTKESLCGIDLGRDVTPQFSYYRRVVEAELAQQALDH